MFGMFTVTTAYKLGELGFSWVFHQSKKTGSRDVSRTIYIKETSEILENTWRHGYTIYIIYMYVYVYYIIFIYVLYICVNCIFHTEPCLQKRDPESMILRQYHLVI